MADGEPGRPTKCTPEVIEAVCENVRLGLPRKWAAIRAGISESVYYHWKAEGQKGLEPYASFLESLTRAEADDMAALVTDVRCATTGQMPGNAQPDWRAQSWLLERRFRGDFGKTTAVELSGPDRGPVNLSSTVQQLTTEQVEAIANAELAKE